MLFFALLGLGVALGRDHGSNGGGCCSRHRPFVTLGVGPFIVGQPAGLLRRLGRIEPAIGYGLFAIRDLLVRLCCCLVAIRKGLVGIRAGLIGF